ncbi:ABC transporter permease [Frateuria aurantia]
MTPRSWGGGHLMQLEQTTHYFKIAVRRAVHNLPIVTLLVGTLAIGIASCMTVLTVFSTLSGDPVPGVSEHLYVASMDSRTVDSSDSSAYTRPASYLSSKDARALVNLDQAPYQAAFASTFPQISTPQGDRSAQVPGLMAYGQAADLLQLAVIHGRSWTRAEEQERLPVVLIDTNLAQRLFATDNAVGRELQMGHRLFHIIGVYVPWKPRTKFMDLPHNDGQVMESAQQVLVPVDAALDGGVGPLTLGDCGRAAAIVSFQSTMVDGCRWLEFWVSLPGSTSLASTQRAVATYARAQYRSGHFRYPPHAKLYRARQWMDINHTIPDEVGINVLLAAAFLLLCMINVAGILAAYFLRRRADMVVRRALGATRRSIFEQHLLEAAAFGLAGGALALPLTWLGLYILRMQPVAYAAAAHPGLSTFALLAALSVLVSMLVGILPAWQACRISPVLNIEQV